MSGYSYAEFCQAVSALHGNSCMVRLTLTWRKTLPPSSHLHCDGPLDAHHVLPKRLLKRVFPHGVYFAEGDGWRRTMPDQVGDYSIETGAARSLGDLLNDGRNGIPVCRRHHDLIENCAINLSRGELPHEVEEFAAELGLRWYLERTYREEEADVAG